MRRDSSSSEAGMGGCSRGGKVEMWLVLFFYDTLKTFKL